MNYLLGRNDENPDGRPNGSEILAANSVIQELLKTNDVLRMEIEWLKQQLVASKKEYTDRDDELKRLRFLVYLNRSRTDGLRTTLKLALEQIDSLPPPPTPLSSVLCQSQGEDNENMPQILNNEHFDVLSNEDSFQNHLEIERIEEGKKINEMEFGNLVLENRSIDSLGDLDSQTSIKKDLLNYERSLSPSSFGQRNSDNMVEVVENGRIISVQSELAVKLERQRQLTTQLSPPNVEERRTEESISTSSLISKAQQEINLPSNIQQVSEIAYEPTQKDHHHRSISHQNEVINSIPLTHDDDNIKKKEKEEEHLSSNDLKDTSQIHSNQLNHDQFHNGTNELQESPHPTTQSGTMVEEGDAKSFDIWSKLGMAP